MQMKFSRLLDVFFSLSVSTFAGTLHVSMLASCEGSNDACGVERGLEGFGMFSGAFVLAQPRLNDEHFYQISKVQSNFCKKLFLAKCRFFPFVPGKWTRYHRHVRRNFCYFTVHFGPGSHSFLAGHVGHVAAALHSKTAAGHPTHGHPVNSAGT